MSANRSSLLGAVAAGMLGAAPSAGADGLALAGVGGATDDSLHGYVGLVLPIGTTLDKDGFLVRLWGEGLSFDYDTTFPGSTTRTEIDGDGFGAEAALGYQVFFDTSRLTAYLGLRYRNIDLDPTDPDSDADNEDLGIKGQAEFQTDLSDRWDASLIGSYTSNLESYWVRLRPGYRAASGIRWGPEIIALGGEKYDKQRFGLFSSGYGFLGDAKLGFNAGAQHDSRQNEFDAYFGASLSYRF